MSDLLTKARENLDNPDTFERMILASPEEIIELYESRQSAERLLGFALFNLNKRRYSATETLIRKAYKALAGRDWDEPNESQI